MNPGKHLASSISPRLRDMDRACCVSCVALSSALRACGEGGWGRLWMLEKILLLTLNLNGLFFPIFFQQNSKNAAGHNFFPDARSEGFSFRGVEVFARRCFCVRNRLQQSATVAANRNCLQPSATVRDEGAMAVPLAMLPNTNFWRFQTSRNIVSCGRRGTW